MRAAAVVFAGSGLDDPAVNEEIDRHLAAMRADGAAVVHLSPHAGGEPDVGVDNAGGIATMIAALVELGHRRIAFLAGPSALFVARDRLAGYRMRSCRGRHRVRSERSSCGRPSIGPAAPSGSTRCSPAMRGSRRSPAPTTCSRSGRWSAWPSSGIEVPGAVSVAGFDDIAIAAMTAPALSTVRLPLRELGRLGYVHAGRVLEGAEAAHEVLPTELVLRGSTGRPAAVALPDARRTDRRAAS